MEFRQQAFMMKPGWYRHCAFAATVVLAGITLDSEGGEGSCRDVTIGVPRPVPPRRVR